MILTYRILLLALLTVHLSGLTCGGNCPDDSCSKCPCGSTPSQVDINEYCNLMVSGTNASVACCKCIISLTSKGNQRYADESGFWRIGVIPYVEQNLHNCPNPTGNPCEWKQNAACVNRVYKEYNCWWIWTEAKKCGCPYDPQKAENIINQIK